LFTAALVSTLLAASASAQTYRGGEVKTYETYLYGRFETRVKAQNALGTVQSFFLYWDGPNWSEA
jgi:beta-glucanase (GH16 family)